MINNNNNVVGVAPVIIWLVVWKCLEHEFFDFPHIGNSNLNWLHVEFFHFPQRHFTTGLVLRWIFQPSFLALQVRLVLQRLREFGRVESRNVEAGMLCPKSIGLSTFSPFFHGFFGGI